MDALRYELMQKHSAALTRGQGATSDFDTARPWDSVWAASITGERAKDFWKLEFELPANMQLTRAANASAGLEGDAPIGTHQLQPQNQLGKSAGKGAAKKPNPDTPGGGSCAQFQLGHCRTLASGVCSRNKAIKHTCAKCGSGKHGSSACPQNGGAQSSDWSAGGDGKHVKKKQNKKKGKQNWK